ncbi:hypothetical protein F8O06_04700 [Pseudoclavibacter sp. CFCC 14310]|uniref:hypothetical protein n=1 Tax=Pseudoclavibacter sp. CFCC 14310 TaxID=2615180 RepID=UPI00130184AC|nr:hypothetical protein [Pseudoclavibacter sp. CFCC 14310]KAB1645475.1 hypothetical protein F8O06_07745 [Pseudoclavibacter sp. CFCC 14310]KAB1646066.1 hypothetical protein F8O06_04700 [Pseudoclavibacter sp. CFCC 14310]
MKGFATQAAFGAAGNVGVYSVTNAADGVLLSKFPDAAAISGANPSWGAHVGAAFAGEHAGLGVDAAKFTAKHVVENITGANAAAPEPNQGTTDSNNGAAQ